jgi:hypothetical protein
MNGRVYDPGLGRFLSVDPVFQFPDDTQSLNPYSYVRNRPLVRIDPTGLEEPTEQNKEVKGASSSQSDSKGTGAGGSKPNRKLNETRDPRRAHFADANRKFEQSGKTGAGTETHRNLSNGTDNRQDAKRFDGLASRLTESINSLVSRLDAATSGGGGAAATGTAIAAEGITGSGVSAEALTAAVLRTLATGGFVAATALVTSSISGDTRKQDYYLHYTTAAGRDGIRDFGAVKQSVADGFTYLTQIRYDSSAMAQDQLSLENAPVGYFRIPAANVEPAGLPNEVGPKPEFGTRGGGIEFRVPRPISIEGATWVDLKQ